jgi:3-oxoacyl-ACP reductase-like protein
MPDLHDAIALLERLAADWRLLDDLPVEDRQRLHRAVARLYLPDSAARRRRDKDTARLKRAMRASREDALLDRTGIRTLRRRPVFTTPNVFPPPDFAPEDVPPDQDTAARPVSDRDCYICHQAYSSLHHFYDQLCPPCAELNFRKRTESADLRGRCALVTGGRVKIGYQACLKLLRCGASVIVTTRFPRDAAARYAREADYPQSGDRLEIAGL